MCIFCEIADHKNEARVVYENDDIMAFLDSNPINEGHILIIPKKHYLDADEMPDELLLEVITISKRIVSAIKKAYKPSGYSIMQNGGQFNDIGHYHMHIFPRYQNDGFGWTDSGEKYDSSEEVAAKIRENL